MNTINSIRIITEKKSLFTMLTRIQFLKVVLPALTIGACNLPQESQDNDTTKGIVSEITFADFVTFDTIANLLDKATKVDTLEYDNPQPFLFFKSGYFIYSKQKSALIVTENTDTTIEVKLYAQKDGNWTFHASVENLEGPGASFHPSFDDYNFDGQKDIYIRVTASNGYSLSRGHLIIIDPLTRKLNIHHEARDLANLRPDNKTYSVLSEELINCKSTLYQEVGIWTNKWMNGQLKTIKKDYPCEPIK